MREDISFFSVSRENAPHQTHNPLRCIRHITCGVHLLARSSDRWRLWLLWRWQIWRRTAHSASRVEYGVAYRAKRAEQFHNELRYSVGIQLSSAVWTNRTAGWELALSNSFDALSNSFEHVPCDKECAVVQSLKPKVTHFVTLEFSFDAVPRGVLKLQNVGSSAGCSSSNVSVTAAASAFATAVGRSTCVCIVPAARVAAPPRRGRPGGLDCSYERSGQRSPRLSSCCVGAPMAICESCNSKASKKANCGN